jgi:hypothetical protein
MDSNRYGWTPLVLQCKPQRDSAAVAEFRSWDRPHRQLACEWPLFTGPARRAHAVVAHLTHSPSSPQNFNATS